ncbi:MAG: hypothetical protein ACMUIE_05330 [Thermoplasmatota archaeon]
MREKLPYFICLILTVFLPLPSIASGFQGTVSFGTGGADQYDEIEKVILDLGNFIENKGQWDRELSYIATASFGHIGIGNGGIYYDVCLGEDRGQVIGYGFVRANVHNTIGSDEKGPVHNYFLGPETSMWASGAGEFGKVICEEVWNGIDLFYSVDGRDSKYEFLMRPGSDHEDIRLQVQGQNDLIIEPDGLKMELDDGSVLKDTGLIAFYEDGERETIGASFVDLGNDVFGFELGQYDRTRSVVIDPFLEYSTVLGTPSSNVDDFGGDFVRDGDGYIYGIGTTGSTTFPTTTGVYDTTANGNWDAVIYKLDPTLSSLIFSTYFGGSQMEITRTIALMGNGSVFIGGDTFSSNLPVSSGAYDTTYQPAPGAAQETDGFLARLDDNCSELGFSTYLGMSGNESIYSIDADASGCLIVSGTTQSNGFPTTTGAFDTTFNGGGTDMFLVKLNASGDKLLKSTYIGGNNFDYGYDMDLIGDHLVYITGQTRSNNFPTTAGAYDTSFNNDPSGTNPFVMKFNVSADSMDFSTYVGAGGYGSGIEVAANGSVHVAGQSASNSFPTTSGAYDTSRNGQEDGVYFRLDASGSSLTYSTFIGGGAWDSLSDVDLDPDGSVYLIGRSRSTGFPTTKGCYDDTLSGGWDMVVSRLDPQGKRLVYSTYLGGSGDESGGRIDLDGSNFTYISGMSDSNNFPTISGAYDTTPNGGDDIVFCLVNLTKVLLEPDRPRNLTGKMVGSKVALRWEEPRDDGGLPITHYTVYKAVSSEILQWYDTTMDLYYEDPDIDESNTYDYAVSANNSLGESFRTPPLTLWEHVPPVFNGDLTEADPKPGIPLTLMANFTDNVKVVLAKAEYRIGNGPTLNMTMANDTAPDIWSYIVPLPDGNFDLRYKFSAKDSMNNWASSQEFTRSVRGEVLPVFKEDRTPTIASVAAPFGFTVNVTDNHGVDKVHLEYWTEGEVHSNVTMNMITGTDDYEFTIIAPNQLNRNIHYIFHAKDIHGNWNHTIEKTVPILDELAPHLTKDVSSSTATTGDPFFFAVEAWDNLRVSSVLVEYWFGAGPTNRADLGKGMGPRWTYDIVIPDSTGPLNYRFILSDPSSNTNTTIGKTIAVLDDDPPVFKGDLSHDSAVTGEEFAFAMRALDNVKIGQIEVQYKIGDGELSRIIMNARNDLFRAYLEIPVNVVKLLNYGFIIEDTSGNSVTTDMFIVQIEDGIPPVVQSIDDIIMYQGERMDISVNATDNIGIKNIAWLDSPISAEGMRLFGIVDSFGTFRIIVQVTDQGGNKASTSFIATILPSDHDSDRDLIIDTVEIEWGLDKDDPTDGDGDLDSDGLTNRDEYLLGTNPRKHDSDGDGMPDRWEYDHGLDYLRSSETNDEDGDGLSDLEEFLGGTDPLMPEKKEIGKEKKETPIWSIILLVIMVLLTIVTIPVLFILGRKEGGEEEIEEPLPEDRIELELEKALEDLPEEEDSSIPEADKDQETFQGPPVQIPVKDEEGVTDPDIEAAPTERDQTMEVPQEEEVFPEEVVR